MMYSSNVEHNIVSSEYKNILYLKLVRTLLNYRVLGTSIADVFLSCGFESHCGQEYSFCILSLSTLSEQRWPSG